jgi:hypothetical protein
MSTCEWVGGTASILPNRVGICSVSGKAEWGTGVHRRTKARPDRFLGNDAGAASPRAGTASRRRRGGTSDQADQTPSGKTGPLLPPALAMGETRPKKTSAVRFHPSAPLYPGRGRSSVRRIVDAVKEKRMTMVRQVATLWEPYACTTI